MTERRTERGYIIYPPFFFHSLHMMWRNEHGVLSLFVKEDDTPKLNGDGRSVFKCKFALLFVPESEVMGDIRH
jgi:hypothetical protein